MVNLSFNELIFKLGLVYLLGMRQYQLEPRTEIYDIYCGMRPGEVKEFSKVGFQKTTKWKPVNRDSFENLIKYLAEIFHGFRDSLSHFLHGK